MIDPIRPLTRMPTESLMAEQSHHTGLDLQNFRDELFVGIEEYQEQLNRVVMLSVNYR